MSIMDRQTFIPGLLAVMPVFDTGYRHFFRLD
jgi:hypothetical protein